MADGTLTLISVLQAVTKGTEDPKTLWDQLTKQADTAVRDESDVGTGGTAASGSGFSFGF